jgi:hypothetical protein
MNQRLIIMGVQGTHQPEPDICEITVILADQSKAMLRMNVSVVEELLAAILPMLEK